LGARADVIRQAVWLYHRFTLSYRDVEDLLAERGLTVSNESIRRWVLKFGPVIAKDSRETRPKPPSLGISMKWWSQSLDGKCICGASSTAKARFSISKGGAGGSKSPGAKRRRARRPPLCRAPR
jgi:hypothetical protein